MRSYLKKLQYDMIHRIRFREERTVSMSYSEINFTKTADLRDYSQIIGSVVKGTIDRPIGSSHPSKFLDMQYPVNYGYVNGVMAADGEEQDIYLLGVDQPVAAFEGIVIAVIHRLNDVEDKWVVAPAGMTFSAEEILRQVEFQEKYFDIQLHL